MGKVQSSRQSEWTHAVGAEARVFEVVFLWRCFWWCCFCDVFLLVFLWWCGWCFCGGVFLVVAFVVCFLVVAFAVVLFVVVLLLSVFFGDGVVVLLVRYMSNYGR